MREEQKINNLEKQIKKHKILYYQGRPEISDAEYDQLEDELKKLDPKNSILRFVGSTVRSEKKVKHKSKMLSLNKTYDIKELKKWIGDRDVISMFKLDGVSCSLIYKNGRLYMAKTRGDGVQGEDITDKVDWMESVPVHIPIKSKETEVRGELYCNEEQFIALAKKMEELELDRPSNPRNIVAGLMGRKENTLLSSYIHFQAFEILDTEVGFKKEQEKFKKLDEFGFETPSIEVHHNCKGIEEAIKKAEDFMAQGDYQIDGLVFVYDDVEYQNELGETSHHPRYKIAFKFKGESKSTTIKSISWQVSRNGVLTPVAEVEKVELSGAIISRVTLHNYGMVKQFNLKKGDKIEIVRSGEVIPKFISVVKSSNEKMETPKECPSCGQDVVERDIRLFCNNEKCPAKIHEGILHFFKNIGVDDISSKRLEEMINKGLVKTIPDLYRLKEEDFYALDKVKEKLAKKFYQNIQNSKKVDLVTFLSSLGISGGGKNKCEKIVYSGYDSIEKIKSLTINELKDVESFAEKSAEEFIRSLKTKYELIDELIDVGIEIEVEARKESPVTGKKVCITGSLSEKRSVIEERLRSFGAVVVGSVSSQTDYLVTNEQEPSSSKYKKAVKHEVPVITEKQLRELLDS